MFVYCGLCVQVQLVTHLDHVQTDFIKIEGKVKRVKEKQDMANQSTVRSFAQQQEISSLLNGEVNDMQRNNQQQLQRVLANVTVLRNVKAEFQAKANALHEELSQIDRTVAELLVKVEADKQVRQSPLEYMSLLLLCCTIERSIHPQLYCLPFVFFYSNSNRRH